MDFSSSLPGDSPSVSFFNGVRRLLVVLHPGQCLDGRGVGFLGLGGVPKHAHQGPGDRRAAVHARFPCHGTTL